MPDNKRLISGIKRLILSFFAWKLSSCLMAHQEVFHLPDSLPLIEMNYWLITPRFRPLSCIYFRGTIIVCALNVLVMMQCLLTP